MGGGNGCKAQQKRDRNAKKKGNTGNSQLKVNKECQTLVCQVCFQTFMSVTNEKSLREHTDNKHAKKSFGDCFPNFNN